MTSSTKNERILATTRSLERDAVRLDGLRRRADLNGCYGIMQRRLTPTMYAVRVGFETIVVTFANVTFVDEMHHSVPVRRCSALAKGITYEAMSQSLILDDVQYEIYSRER